ncbi:hypothetical protein JTE90_029264 [Oedothorax gibbosus]|uniref:SWIM-type domain-containing protein n=1 Tax=Oedothorax gibbosus TaxID=931172 RepID=A0AAV6TV05_9ARAC|nr:hypothetical protein JTE90_029264 [Oedothorax gibbosus]
MTNNRLESINGKIKSVVTKNSSLEGFISSFFSYIKSIRYERDREATTALLRVPDVFPPNSAEESYPKALLPYPFSRLLKQLEMSANTKMTEEGSLGNFTKYKGILLDVSPLTCQCLWHKSMRMPCAHVLSVRRKLNISMFDLNFCDPRWIKSNYLSVDHAFHQLPEPERQEECGISQIPDNVPKTCASRYRKLLPLLHKMADVASESTGEDFLKKDATLKQILGSRSVCGIRPVSDRPCNVKGSQLSIHLWFEHTASHGTTVIGLKRKKSCRPVPFTHKPRAERQVVMLKWFVPEAVASDALKKGKCIEEEDVEVDPTKISSSCLESFVNLDEVKHFLY